MWSSLTGRERVIVATTLSSPTIRTLWLWDLNTTFAQYIGRTTVDCMFELLRLCVQQAVAARQKPRTRPTGDLLTYTSLNSDLQYHLSSRSLRREGMAAEETQADCAPAQV